MSNNPKDVAIMNSRLKKLKNEAKNSNLTYKIDQIVKGTAGYYIIFANRLIFKSVKFNNEALDDISELIKGNISLTNTNYFTQTSIKDIKNDISTIEIINLYPEYRDIRTAKDGSGNDIIVGVKPDSFDDITNSVFNEDKVYIKKVNHLYNKDDSIHLLNTISGQVSEAELEMLAKFLNTPTLDIDDHINTDFINDNYETTSDLIAYKNIELYEDPIVYGDYTYKQYKITDINDTEYFLVYQIKNSDKDNIKTVYLQNAYAFIDPLMGLGLLICNHKRIKDADIPTFKTVVIDNEGNICKHTINQIDSKSLGSWVKCKQFSITYNENTIYKIYKIHTITGGVDIECIYTDRVYAFIDPLMELGLLICDYRKINNPSNSSYKTVVIDNEGNICNHTIEHLYLNTINDWVCRELSITYNEITVYKVYKYNVNTVTVISCIYTDRAYAFIDPLMELGLLICDYRKINNPSNSSYKTVVIDNEGNICNHTIEHLYLNTINVYNCAEMSITYNNITVYKIYKYNTSMGVSCVYTDNEYYLIPKSIYNDNLVYILYINPKLIQNITKYSEKETKFAYIDENGNSTISNFKDIARGGVRGNLLRFQLGFEVPYTSKLYLIYCMDKTVINDNTISNFVKSTVPGKFTTFSPTGSGSSSYCAWTEDSSSFNSSKTSFTAYVFDDTTINIHGCAFNSIESAIYDTTHYIRQYKATVKITSTSETLTLYSLIYNNITYRVGVTGYMMYYPSGSNGIVRVLRRRLIDDPSFSSKISVYNLRTGEITNDYNFKCKFTVQSYDTIFAFIQHDCNYADYNNIGDDNPSVDSEGHAKTKLEYIVTKNTSTNSYSIIRYIVGGLSYKFNAGGNYFCYNKYINYMIGFTSSGSFTTNPSVQDITSIYDGLSSGYTAYRVKWGDTNNKSYDMILIYNSKDELVSTESLPTVWYPFTAGGKTFYASTYGAPIYESSSTIFKKYTDVVYIDITDVYDSSTSNEKYIVKWGYNNSSYTYKGIMKLQTNGNFASYSDQFANIKDPVVIELQPNTGGILSNYRTGWSAIVCEPRFKEGRVFTSNDYFYFMGRNTNSLSAYSTLSNNVKNLTRSHYVSDFNHSVDVHQWYLNGPNYTLLEYNVLGQKKWDLFTTGRSNGLGDFTLKTSSSGGAPVARFYMFATRNFGPPINSSTKQTLYGIMIRPENYTVTDVRIEWDGTLYAKVYDRNGTEYYSIHKDTFSTVIEYAVI